MTTYLITEAQIEELRKVLPDNDWGQSLEKMMQSLPIVDSEPVAWTTMPTAKDWEFISGKGDPNKVLLGEWFPLYTSPQALAPITADDVTDEMVDAYLTSDAADWRDFTPELQLAARQVVARIVTAYISIRS